MNGICTEIVIDSGAELSVINHKFVSKHKQLFKRSLVLPINNTQLQTGVNTKEKNK